MKLLRVEHAGDGVHKYKAVFLQENGRTKTTNFGAVGYSDYLHHKSKERRRLYLDRHRHREDWTDPTRAGTLSAFLLWGESTSFDQNLAHYKSHFHL